MRDHIRDYATSAFKFYAENGKSVEKFKKHLYKQALQQQQRLEGTYGISKPTESAIIRAEQILEERKAEIKDMEAVEKTVGILERMSGGTSIIKALQYVYFEPTRGKRINVKERVHKAEIFIPASERTIYYWLRKARDIFAIERNLRT